MSGVFGVDIQTDDKRYHAHFALVDAGAVVASSSHHAPAGEDESVQLAELQVRMTQLIDQHQPESIALKALESGGRALKLADANPKIRASGALMAAAGARDISCHEVAGPTLRAALGPKCKTVEAIDHLCGQLTGDPEAGCDGAAAVAHLVDSRP